MARSLRRYARTSDVTLRMSGPKSPFSQPVPGATSARYDSTMASPSFPWPVATGQPRLSSGSVHVWCLALDLAEKQVDQFRATLSADERERADRYHFDRHRRRFMACRGQVRRILAGYLNARPAALGFQYGTRGKPALAAPWSGSDIQFNVSNSDDVALLAIALGRELGVDVEHVREPRDFESLAAQFFDAGEVAQLRSLPLQQRREAFFHCWTRKEAVLKAVGTGLSFPLDKVIVTLRPDEPARVVSLNSDQADPANWWLCSPKP